MLKMGILAPRRRPPFGYRIAWYSGELYQRPAASMFGHSLITTRCGANLDREKQQAIWVSGFDGSDKSF